MDEFHDWGHKEIDPDFPDIGWINDPTVYPKTSIYRDQYVFLREIVLALGIKVTRYLSLGTGLGRHVILADEMFEDLEQIVTVDHHIVPHKTVQALKVHHSHHMDSVSTVLKNFSDDPNVFFDFICFENIGHDHGVSSVEDLSRLIKVLAPRSILAIIGDTKFDTEMLRASDEFLKIPPMAGDFGDTTKDSLWYRI